jgi:hypothetical protein
MAVFGCNIDDVVSVSILYVPLNDMNTGYKKEHAVLVPVKALSSRVQGEIFPPEDGHTTETCSGYY